MDAEVGKKLGRFSKRIKRLRENKNFFTNLTVKLNFTANENARTATTGPDLKTIKATRVDFRPFVLNDEPISFNPICVLGSTLNRTTSHFPWELVG